MEPLFAFVFFGYTSLITLILVWIVTKLVVHIKEDDQVHKDVVKLEKLVAHIHDTLLKGKK